MITIKKCFSLQVIIGMAIASLSACKNSSETGFLPDTEYKQPVEFPLKFSDAKKIGWDTIHAVAVQPVIKKLDFNKLPSHSYDTAGLKPFTRPVTEAKFDYNALPEKDFDIDKLPSKALKYKTYLLEPPKLIKAGLPHLKNPVLQLYEMGQAQGMEGLVFSSVYTDHEGFIWIATDKGLYRYDGENLWLYLHGQFDFYIISIMEDKAGRIWLCKLNGLLEVLDTKAGTLKKIDKSMGLVNNNMARTLQDVQGRIWVAFEPGGVNIIDTTLQSVKYLDKAHGLSDTSANTLLQDKNHNIWIGTDVGGMDVIDLKSKKIKYLDKAHGLRSDSVENLLFDHDGRAWVALHGKIDVLDFQKNTTEYINEPLFSNPSSPNSFVRTISQDGTGKVWAGNFNFGLEIIDLENRRAKKLAFPDIPADRVISITQDSRGQTWIGTAGGLDMVPGTKALVEQIGAEQTNTLLEDAQGFIWQGTGKGVNIFDRKTKTVKNIGTAQGLAHDNIETVSQIDGSISICTDAGWDVLDPAKTTITHLGVEQGLNSRVEYAILKDNAGRFWLGSGKSGLNVYDPKTKTLKYLGPAQGITKGATGDIKKDTRGRLWLGLQGPGLDVIDPSNWTVQHINGLPGFKDNFSKVLLPDDKGNMWIGTDRGVYLVDVENKKVLSFSIPQGLVNESVTSILSKGGPVYVSTNGGVSEITSTGTGPGKKWTVKSLGLGYTGAKNFPGSSLTDQLTKDGLYWWGDKGLTVLDFSKKDAFVPKALITGMNTMDQPRYFVDHSLIESKDKDTLWDKSENNFEFGKIPKNTGYALQSGSKWDDVYGPYNMPLNLQLPHDQNFIQFHFSSFNLMAHDTAWYRYRLVGVDTSWSEKTSIPTSRNYFSLVPGKYTFEVIGKSSDNGWSKPASFTFTINPPWWQTWWAYILYVLVFAGIIWAFVSYRSRQLLKEKRILEHKVHVRTEEVMQQKEEIEAQRDDLEKTLSELKTTQTQLIQSEKMASLGELTAGIAHEIQNPLNFVNNFAEVSVELLNELKEGALQHLPASAKTEADEIVGDITENLQKISHHGKRADSIVKGMLQHSRNSSGQKELTDINVLADEYLRLSFHGLRAKDKSFNATMDTHFDETLPKLNMMQQDFGRVLLNLFTNAFYSVTAKKKLMANGYEPTVAVTTKRSGNFIEVIVKDNGMGIPQKILDKIYQPFFTTKPTGQGTGLGLSMSYDIVKAHEGELSVKTVEGEFAEFSIKLPLS